VNPLEELLARRIRTQGPLTVAEFMAEALGHPEYGYYATRDPLGRRGDFTTAPEISQIFGELVGLWCVDLWDRAGRPDPFILAELGPGRGTLMTDALRAARVAPQFLAALRLHFVETSKVLRQAQHRALKEFAPVWHDSVASLPRDPCLVIANEFLDALPIRQLVRGGVDWAERAVVLDTEDRLVFADGPEHPALTLLVPPTLRALPPGSVVEIGSAAAALAAALGARLAQQPGAALFVDYGYFPSRPGPTLAALRRHQAAAVLDDPGSADLSAHVDFAVFAAAARAAGAVVYGPVTQGRFLAALGAEARLGALAAGAMPAQRALLGSGLKRLLDPAQMGNLFKVLALTSPGLPQPAGFE
jgi:NADH dehydrogenase [ubiquinone] 1 alpha subcomplex assembly factor 7